MSLMFLKVFSKLIAIRYHRYRHILKTPIEYKERSCFSIIPIQISHLEKRNGFVALQTTFNV